MALTNAQSIYDYIMSRPTPSTWKTPDSLKKSYNNALDAAKAFQPQINAQLEQYADYSPVTQTREYRGLLDMYNKEYEHNAALAAAEAVKASENANAGYGDTYSKAATEQALTGYMANRGAAVPTLLAAAADARSANKSAIAVGINAMSNQRDISTAALQSLFSSQLGGVQNEVAAKQQAYKSLVDSLSDLYSYQYGVENPTSSGRSSGRSGAGGGTRTKKGTTTEGNNDDDTPETKSAEQIAYEQAIANYPLLKNIMKPDDFFKNGGENAKYNYFQYIDNEIQKYYKKNGTAKIKPSEFRGSNGGHYTK